MDNSEWLSRLNYEIEKAWRGIDLFGNPFPMYSKNLLKIAKKAMKVIEKFDKSDPVLEAIKDEAKKFIK